MSCNEYIPLIGSTWQERNDTSWITPCLAEEEIFFSSFFWVVVVVWIHEMKWKVDTDPRTVQDPVQIQQALANLQTGTSVAAASICFQLVHSNLNCIRDREKSKLVFSTSTIWFLCCRVLANVRDSDFHHGSGTESTLRGRSATPSSQALISFDKKGEHERMMSMTGGGIYPEMDDQSEPLTILVISCDSLAVASKLQSCNDFAVIQKFLASRYFEGRSWGCAGHGVPVCNEYVWCGLGNGLKLRQAQQKTCQLHCLAGKDEHAESFHEQAATICFYKKSLYNGLLPYNVTRHIHRCIISDGDQCCTYSFRYLSWFIMIL